MKSCFERMGLDSVAGLSLGSSGIYHPTHTHVGSPRRSGMTGGRHPGEQHIPSVTRRIPGTVGPGLLNFAETRLPAMSKTRNSRSLSYTLILLMLFAIACSLIPVPAAAQAPTGKHYNRFSEPECFECGAASGSGNRAPSRRSQANAVQNGDYGQRLRHGKSYPFGPSGI